MFKINLIPEVQEKKEKLKKTNALATAVAVAIVALCVISALGLGGFYFVKKNELADVEKNIKNVQEEIAQYKDLEETVISLEKGLAGVKQILDGGNRWTKLLSHLEKATPNDVAFTNLKLSGNAVEASLKGKTINSLARFMESYKAYKVIAITGSSVTGKTVNVSVDGGPKETVMVKSDGKWLYAANFDPATDHTISVDVAEGKAMTIKYSAKEKKIETNESGVNAETKNLFSEVEVKEYQKKENSVEFTAKFNFESGSIW